MVTIAIKDLELWTRIGLTQEERAGEQRILATILLELEGCKACETDHIEDTVDYERICAVVKDLARGKRSTLEKFAGDIVHALQGLPNMTHASVELKKFVLLGTEHVSVTLTQP